MKNVNWYLEEVDKLYDTVYYGSVFHQITTDMLEDVQETLYMWQEEPRVTLEDLLGSLHYRADILLEVMDKELKDCEIIKKLIEILKTKDDE